MRIPEERIRQVILKSRADGVEKLLISDPVAIYYLTGVMLRSGERFLGLILSPDQPPVLYVNALLHFPDSLPFPVVRYRDGEDILGKVIQDIRTEKKLRLGVDKNLPARFLLPILLSGSDVSLTDASRYVDDCRAVKDAAEQELMIRSSEINDRTMERALSLVTAGMTEIELAGEIEKIYRSLGADGLAFSPKPAFGSNTGSPHHSPGNKALQEGEVIRLDIGCTCEHYCSDMTRTVFFRRQATDFERRIYDLVYRANTEAEQIVRPGIRLKEIDHAARQIITEGGYGEYFTHRLGHFIGLEDHDDGDVSAQNEKLTQAGHIFSIEPGIYLPQKLGIRIEDLVLVTENSVKILNHFPKELYVLE